MSSLYHLLLLSTLFQICFSADVPPLINQICTKTQNNNFCVQTLTSAPGAATADLPTLAAFSLKSTYDAVADADAYLLALLPNISDPSLKQVGTHCKTDYAGSIPPLLTAIASLGEGHFDDVSINVNRALTNINDCDRVMKIGPRPLGLPEKHTNIVQLIDISNVINIMLLPPPGLPEENTNVVQLIDISN